jgi:Domain of unknown function (DUF5615)
MIRFYMDEDALEGALVLGLRSRGLDVLTAREAQMLGQNDCDHLAYSTSLGRVLVSYNVGDYCALNQEWLADGRSFAGMIVRKACPLAKSSGLSPSCVQFPPLA